MSGVYSNGSKRSGEQGSLSTNERLGGDQNGEGVARQKVSEPLESGKG